MVCNEASVGLIYMRNRWYDPFLGRFITQDPFDVRGGLNLYEYSLNNPLNRIDPFGLNDVGTNQSEAKIGTGLVQIGSSLVEATATEGLGLIPAAYNLFNGAYSVFQGGVQYLQNIDNSVYVPAPDPLLTAINNFSPIAGTAYQISQYYQDVTSLGSTNIANKFIGASDLEDKLLTAVEQTPSGDSNGNDTGGTVNPSTDGGSNSNPNTGNSEVVTAAPIIESPWQTSLDYMNSQTPDVAPPEAWQTSLQQAYDEELPLTTCP
jgi:RHS repeat-associated protein